MEERDDIIVLKDEEGNEIEFEYLDTVDYDGREFVVLLPVAGEDAEDGGEVVILEVRELDGSEEFLPVEEKELNEVFELFKERIQDEFCDEEGN